VSPLVTKRVQYLGLRKSDISSSIQATDFDATARLAGPAMNRPFVPLSQFVLKMHSRCDLACDHCYVYETADQSWHGRPMVISDQVISRTVQRIAEHARAHRMPFAQVVLHGGEPLLTGRVTLRRMATELPSALAGSCEFFVEHDVRIGISIDGDRAANDRHRRYADGRSSYNKVIWAIELLRTNRFQELSGGLLCPIDIANESVTVYESLISPDPPQIDFLLPHATWDRPPTRHRRGVLRFHSLEP
jgi:uncharacterized protein